MTDKRRGSDQVAARAVAQRSDAFFKIFGWVFEHTFKKGFHAARIASGAPLALPRDKRIVIYTNHPSWWDGVTYVLLAKHLYPNYRVYTPVDAEVFGQYGFIARIGAFGVTQNSRRGAVEFISGSKAVFALPDGLLIVAAQGRFADPRERPLACGAGIAHLPDHVSGLVFIPLAIEYPLWSEKQPELLLKFGQAIDGQSLIGLPVRERLARLEGALESEMNQLAALAIAREEKAFDVWLLGTMGVNPIYDAWRRLTSKLRGRNFSAEHGPRT
ncbi:MAG: lysophospholipid acyltransferase family protein [Hyphomicrobiales bacterium]|nr:lysophospholipid acyltransferase family protein [Hyphomicrobiales bacterium]